MDNNKSNLVVTTSDEIDNKEDSEFKVFQNNKSNFEKAARLLKQSIPSNSIAIIQIFSAIYYLILTVFSNAKTAYEINNRLAKHIKTLKTPNNLTSLSITTKEDTKEINPIFDKYKTLLEQEFIIIENLKQNNTSTCEKLDKEIADFLLYAYNFDGSFILYKEIFLDFFNSQILKADSLYCEFQSLVISLLKLNNDTSLMQ